MKKTKMNWIRRKNNIDRSGLVRSIFEREKEPNNIRNFEKQNRKIGPLLFCVLSPETQYRYDRLQVYCLSIMYGGSSKLGRNGGVARGIGAKRPHSSHPLPPPHRQSGPAGAGRLSSIGGRVSGSASNPRSRGSIQSAPPAAVEENFSLVSGNNPPAFAMIIRLAPDLVDEIKRLEAQAGTARIKFDVNASNSSGNVSLLLKFQLG